VQIYRRLIIFYPHRRALANGKLTDVVQGIVKDFIIQREREAASSSGLLYKLFLNDD